MADLMHTIRGRMIALHMTQSQVAEVLGTSQGRISEYLNRRRQPGLRIIERWLDALELEVRPVG